jgi:hypothetical protein
LLAFGPRDATKQYRPSGLLTAYAGSWPTEMILVEESEKPGSLIKGVRVTGSPPQGIVLARARELLEIARYHGYRPDELADMIRALS